ncbi:hypothetical protein Tco_0760043 [Tanacetum coccineum]
MPEEMTKTKNDVKARGLLLMILPNEHQLTFSQYPDAKSMFAAIKTRFGDSAATKKTQKTLLKQHYKKFSATMEILLKCVSKGSTTKDRQKFSFNGSAGIKKQGRSVQKSKTTRKQGNKGRHFPRHVGYVVEEVVVLKREVGIKQYEINMLKTEFEKVKQEKDGIEFKIKKFDKASKHLDQLLESQITNKSKKGLGYSVVPPPHPLIYNRHNKLDLSYSGIDEFKEPEFKRYGPENSKKKSNVVCENESENSKKNSDKSLVKEQESQVKSSFVEGCGTNTSKNVSKEEPKKVRKNNDSPIIEDWVSDDEEQNESMTKPVKKTVIPTAAKIEKPVKKSVRYAEMYRSQRPRGNQRN